MDYSTDNAATYKEIGVDNSTYAISLRPAMSAMGDMSNRVVLDYGAGTGRTAVLLKEYGAGFVLGVDKSPSMIRLAERRPGIVYLRTGRSLPFVDNVLDGAMCANVFPEFSSRDQILHSCREIWRVLTSEAPFVVVVTNPESVNCDYVSYRYVNVLNPQSGSRIRCLIKGDRPFYIQDYYWTMDDYSEVLESAGFTLVEVLLPKAEPNSGDWLDEPKVAPDAVLVSKRNA